jgi:diguanylate cyclase (GGDEF)-like protein
MTVIVLRDLLLVLVTALVLLFGIFILALRRSRHALLESQERLGLTLRASKIGIWSWRIPDDVISADENCSMLFGLPLGEFPRAIAGFSALVHPDDRSRVQEEVSATVRRQADYDAEFRVVWPGGLVRHLAARAKIYDNTSGAPLRLTGVCWDVTARRQAEDQLREVNDKLKQSLATLQRHKEQGMILSEMAELLHACTNSAEAYDLVVRFCAHLFPTYAGALFIYSASRNLVTSVAAWNNPVLGETSFEPEDCWALRRGHPHVIDQTQFATPCRHLKDVQCDRHACIPLVAQGTGLGIMYLQHDSRADTEAAEGFLIPERRQVAVAVAEHISLSLANISLHEALRLQSIRDPLTGLFNRRYLEESVERELHRAARREQSAGFLMMDLDHFKTFNDTFGHEGGDALLRAFGQFLREHLRKEDIACRYGGEEFCMLFCESTLDDSARRAEQLRHELKRLPVDLGGRQLGSVTISIGVAAYPLHGNTVGDLITAADMALYQAKADGRDRVVVATAGPMTTPTSQRTERS